MNIFPRTPATQEQRAEAHRILDAARSGAYITTERITWALRITGDLEG